MKYAAIFLVILGIAAVYWFASSRSVSEENSQSADVDPSDPGQMVVLYSPNPWINLEVIKELEKKFSAVLEPEGIGFVDGHEVAVTGEDFFLYFFGKDARIVFEEVQKVALEEPMLRGAEARIYLTVVADENIEPIIVKINDELRLQ